ncbi:MAG: hypothetical protein WA802_07615 [Terracidiphilus sp.]
MPLPSSPDNGNALMIIEGGLTAIAFAVAFAVPRLGSAWFARIERTFSRFAHRQGLAVASVGLATLLLRLAILPLFPIPLPFIHDDFSHLLAADTFAHGRLTNPTPAMWTHFESFHITMQPTYMSMYFPGEGLILAASKVLFGSPWFGILICSALMCAAICWMLQAWLPPAWALLGGIVAMLRLGLFSYWVNTYAGGGLITGLGGALVLGALPRLMKTARLRYGIVMAIGMILLGLTRPYEGMLLCLPVAVALGHWALFGKNRLSPAVLLRRAAAPLLLIVAAVAWLGYYDYRAFGSPTTLPYTIDRATYAVAPYFVWQRLRPEPQYRHAVMREFYTDLEVKEYPRIHSWSRFVPLSCGKVLVAILFFAGFALLPPLIMLRRALMDRRIRFLALSLPVLMAGMAIEIFMIPHYLAPFTVVFYALGLQAMRHLRVWMPEGKPVGATMVRLTVTVCFVMAGARLLTGPLHLEIAEWPAAGWSSTWRGPEHFGTERAQIQARLEQFPGEQLAIVRYSSGHNPLDEWVYNLADIDGSKVVWAREMDAANNLELMRYYQQRKVWLVEPDATPAVVVPYPIAEPPSTGKN